MLLREEHTPRWIIFMIDVGICLFSLTLAYLLRFNFAIPEVEFNYFTYSYPLLIIVRACSFLIAGTYRGIIRYTSTKDAQRIFITITVGSCVFCIINLLRYHLIDTKYLIPFSVVIIDYICTIFLLISSRITVKIFYLELRNPSKEKANVIIFGAGEAGIIAKRAIDRDRGTKYKVTNFIDDNAKKVGTKIEGVRIRHGEELDELLANNEIHHLIISVQTLPPKRKSEIVESCLAHNVKVLNVPPVSTWINGELSFRQIKKVKIEELLGRDPIELDEEGIKKQLKGKVVLITGAAGSIGQGLVKQVARYKPKQLILLDQAESPLYEVQLDIQNNSLENTCEVVIGDIRNADRMQNLFETYRPEIVYHAAAYKHVPMMEENPSEAVRTNILGTRTIVDLAIKYGTERFVMISTDKAVNPTNVMGASKRVAEIYAQSINKTCDTSFITSRFGNVLGSNGSVIPLFRKQIEKGGPVTVTHKEITRYFMTIPEACQLVLEAGKMGEGGEIFIFDMGQSVRIYDLAKKMIKLSGLELGKDIQIKFTGMRAGEKLYEELLTDTEKTIPTHHSQIMIATVREYDFAEISQQTDELIQLYEQQNNEAIVKKIKEIVPEYVSQNSVYSALDSEKAEKTSGSVQNG